MAVAVAVLPLALACAGGEGRSAKDTSEVARRPDSARSGSTAVGDSARVERLTPHPAPVPIIPESAAAGASRAAADTSRPVALFVGTSLTAGYGLDPEQAYPAMVQARIDSAGFNVRVVNAGLSGETSAGALRRLDWLLRQRADLVMIETGANDGLRGLDIDSTEANLLAILRKVHAERPAALVFLAQMEAPPNLGSEYTSRFHAMFALAAREGGAVLMPFLLDGVAGIARLNQQDGIHPNLAGERIVAENVWRSLAPSLARLGR